MTIANKSRFKIIDGYLACSHPILFGFRYRKILDEIEGGGVLRVPLAIRAVGFIGLLQVKFVARYRVIVEPGEAEGTKRRSVCRISRVMQYVNIGHSFLASASVTCSSTNINDYNVCIQAQDVNGLFKENSKEHGLLFLEQVSCVLSIASAERIQESRKWGEQVVLRGEKDD